MRPRSVTRLVVVASAICLLIACHHSSPGQRPEALVAPLMKLTPAIQSVLLYPDNNLPVTDDRLFEEAVKDKPELRGAFLGLPVRIEHDKRDVVVLVCSPDGKYGWIEDASWTVEVDKKWYEVDAKHPAVFTLPLRAAAGDKPSNRN